MNHHGQSNAPRVIAWELTRRCSLNCRHCRGSARDENYSSELTTDEIKATITNLASFKAPIVLILTGGEPMSRPDIFEIAQASTDAGLHTVMAPCGHLITPETAKKLADSGVKAISISIDAATEAQHDEFRGIPGAYKKTIAGLQHAINAGIPFQINTTVTKLNINDLPAIHDMAVKLGAKTLDLFFLVPTGRASELQDLEISPSEHEEALLWAHDLSLTSPINVKTTCAPHFARIQKQSEHKPTRPSGGCMAGRGFVFISHRGILQPCGFFDRPCGDLREANFDFVKLYNSSEIFNDLRQPDNYSGKCGICEYRMVCGGCRARAMTHTGDYMTEEPSCNYEPKPKGK